MRDHDERKDGELPGGAAVETAPARPAAAPERKLVFLRTVYPLNPGIPHYLDFPQRAD